HTHTREHTQTHTNILIEYIPPSSSSSARLDVGGMDRLPSFHVPTHTHTHTHTHTPIHPPCPGELTAKAPGALTEPSAPVFQVVKKPATQPRTPAPPAHLSPA